MLHYEATLQYEGTENIIGLVRAFFSEFNARNFLQIKDGKVTLHVFFEEDKLPDKLISAMESCKNLEFSYNGISTEEEEEKEEEQEDVGTESIQTSAEVPAVSAVPAYVPPYNRLNTSYGIKEIFVDEYQNSSLDEFASDSDSYDQFLEKVVNWLEISKFKEYFFNMVKEISRINGNFSLNSIEKILKENGIDFGPYNRIYITKKVRERFGSSQKIWFKDFLMLMRKYKNYFKDSEVQVQDEHKKSNMSDSIDVHDENETIEELIERVGMEELDVSEKVKKVFFEMGLNNLPTETKDIILEVVNTAIESNNPVIEDYAARATLATFIDEYAKNNNMESIKTEVFIDLLRRLKE